MGHPCKSLGGQSREAPADTRVGVGWGGAALGLVQGEGDSLSSPSLPPSSDSLPFPFPLPSSYMSPSHNQTVLGGGAGIHNAFV